MFCSESREIVDGTMRRVVGSVRCMEEVFDLGVTIMFPSKLTQSFGENSCLVDWHHIIDDRSFIELFRVRYSPLLLVLAFSYPHIGSL